MKRAIAIVLVFVCAVSVGAQQRKTTSARTLTATLATAQTGACAVHTAVQFTWQYAPNFSACTTNGTLEACYNGFTLTDTTSGAVLAGPGTLAGQLAPSAVSFLWTPSGGLFTGTHIFSLVANGFDAGGSALVSAADTVTVTNNLECLNAPTGLTAAAQ
jgi:hypothetical protein